jgi:hypothetical protein
MIARLIVLLLLIPSICFAGPTARKFAAVSAQRDSANHDLSGFEGGVVEPWDGAGFNIDTEAKHAGTYSIKALAPTTLTRTLTVAPGYFTLWVKPYSGSNPVVTVMVGSTTVISATVPGPTIWYELRGYSAASGSQLVSISYTSLQSLWVDDISVPVP